MTASCLDTWFPVDLQFCEQVVDKRAHFTLMGNLRDAKFATNSRNDNIHFCHGNVVCHTRS